MGGSARLAKVAELARRRRCWYRALPSGAC